MNQRQRRKRDMLYTAEESAFDHYHCCVCGHVEPVHNRVTMLCPRRETCGCTGYERNRKMPYGKPFYRHVRAAMRWIERMA